MGNSRVGRIKVVGIPGGKPKIEEKTRISKGSMEKNGKFQGGRGKFDSKFDRGGTIFFS